jgi:membrane associated rhomboid family serine protease
MAYRGGGYQRQVRFGGFGPMAGGPPPRDVLVLLGVVFATYALQFFQSTAIVPFLLHLSPYVWQRGFVWQLVTYAFAGYGPPSLWFLLELLVLWWFATDVYYRLGRRRFWRTLIIATAGAGVVAVAVHLLFALVLAGSPTAAPFDIMQGQHTLLVIVIAAFATLYGDATILLFFVLPVRARWFLWIPVLFGFISFLAGHDIGGFGGVCAATFVTYRLLSGRGGPRRWWLRLKEQWLRWRLDLLRRRRRIHVVDDRDDKRPPWVN